MKPRLDNENADPVEEEKRRRRDKEPLAFCAFIVRRPGLSFGFALGAHILVASINFMLLGTGYDILPIDFNVFPVELTRSHEMAQREEAWSARNSHPDSIRRFTFDDIGPTWDRGFASDQLVLYYTRNGGRGNVFTREVLIQMQTIEDNIFLKEDYQDNLCQVYQDGSCIKPRSVLRYFDGTFRNISDLFEDPGFDNVCDVLNEAHMNPQTTMDFDYFLGQGFIIDEHQCFSNVTRTSIPMGWPLPGNGSNSDKRKLQETFLLNTAQPYLYDMQEKTTHGLELNFFSFRLFSAQVQNQAFRDMALAIGSLAFIFLFLWLQTRSIWITFFAVLSILTCFMITNLIYRTVLNYQYFGYLNIISIFIILGIGADDIFVFVNTWKATEFEEYKSIAHRMSDCYRTAALAMFFTSFTTMSAFLIGGISPVLPIGSFGLFTGILILVNYISVIIYFPTVIAMHHAYFEKRCCPCGCCYSCRERQRVDTRTSDIDSPEAHVVPKREQKPSVFVRFFRGPYFRFITHRVTRWVVICIFAGLIGFFIWSATRLEVDAEEIKIYRSNTNMGRAMNLEGTAFIPSGDNFVHVILAWGMGPRDMSACHRSDYLCEGEQIWDETFDLNTPPAQFALQDFCHLLRYGLSQEQLETLMIRNNSFTGELEIDCFIDGLTEYLKDEGDANNMSLELPLMQTKMTEFMSLFPLLYNPDRLPPQFYRYFEIGVSNWLTSGYSFAITDDYIIYDQFLGEVKDPPNTQAVVLLEALNMTDIGFYGTKLKYAGIRVNLSLSTQGLNYLTGLPVMNAWEDFFNEQLEKMPTSLRGGLQLTEVTWHSLLIQKELVSNAQLGIIIGICIAFVVLVVATMNIITGLLATLVIACVTVSSLGVLPLAGWRVDVMISMNLCLLVGLSVDYVVHMAEAYYQAPNPDRMGKVQYMLEKIGVSVLCGALTTIGAAIFMLPARIQFFLQFGTFLLCTIGFSLVYTLTIFTVVLSMIGPEGNVGNIAVPFVELKRRITGRAPTDVDCVPCKGKGFVPLPVLSPSDIAERERLNNIFSNYKKPDDKTRIVHYADNIVFEKEDSDLALSPINKQVQPADFEADATTTSKL